MPNRYYKFLALCLVSVWLFGFGVAPESRAASDSRFFGTYCGTHVEQITVRSRVWFFGWHTISRRNYRLDLAVRLNAKYQETIYNKGVVMAEGTATVISDTIPDVFSDFAPSRDPIPFVFAGVVTETGRLQGSALTTNREQTYGFADLSNSGNTIKIRGLDRLLTLSKESCGNTRPVATITAPVNGTFQWSDPITFQGTASDAEDASIPPERLVWASSIDGRIGNGFSLHSPFGRVTFLSPGTHTISFTVTDSGGLSHSVEKQIIVDNNLPKVWIDEPSGGDRFYTGLPITLRGRATDQERGGLTGEALVWTYDDNRPIGTGNLLLTQRLPVGEHTITLRASDGEDTTSTSVRITIQLPPLNENTHPAVSIISPANYSGISDSSDDCFSLAAVAEDLQDGPLRGDAIVWRDQQDGVTALRELGLGESLEACGFSAGATDTSHTISVTATDSAGESHTNSIQIYVIPGGLF